MRLPRLCSFQFFAFITLISVLPTPSIGQSAPPDKTRGVSRAELAKLDLSGEIDGIGQRTLAQHRTTIEPGGVIAVHGHIDQPQIIYVATGRIVDHQGERSVEYVAGQAYAIGKATRHWIENAGSDSAIFIGTTVIQTR